MNPELARQDDHADALRAGCSHSVHFLDRQRCSSASPWLCRRLDQRVVRLTNRLNSPAEPLTPRGNKPLNPRSPVPATLHCRWATLIRNSGLTNEQTESAIESEAFGPLAAELRRAEANHHDVDVLLPRLVAARGFGDADDIAAVLHYRVVRATGRPAGSGRTCKPSRLIVGLLPRAHGVIDAEMRAALDEREALIEARAAAVLDGALTDNVPWTKALGAQPRVIVKTCGSACHATFCWRPDSSGRSTSLPRSKVAPARTRATRCGALTARQRRCADSMSLNAIAMPAAREPGPLVTR